MTKISAVRPEERKARLEGHYLRICASRRRTLYARAS